MPAEPFDSSQASPSIARTITAREGQLKLSSLPACGQYSLVGGQEAASAAEEMGSTLGYFFTNRLSLWFRRWVMCALMLAQRQLAAHSTLPQAGTEFRHYIFCLAIVVVQVRDSHSGVWYFPSQQGIRRGEIATVQTLAILFDFL